MTRRPRKRKRKRRIRKSDLMTCHADEDVRVGQTVQVETDKKVSFVLFAAEQQTSSWQNQNSTHVFMSKCHEHERGYVQYSDGLCYKLSYSTNFSTCDESDAASVPQTRHHFLKMDCHYMEQGNCEGLPLAIVSLV